MLALEKSSIASSNSNKATLSQDILTTKRKRCMSIDERNQFVGKRLKIVYIATLPQNLTKLPRNSQIGNALSMAKPETINSDTNTKLGTTKNTDKIQINNENNQIASEWNDKDINGDMLKWNKNVNTTNSQVLQSQNPMQYSTSKECKKYTTSTGGSTITGTEKEGCTLSGAKVILSKQTHASHATDNISMDINGTENSPRILNSSQVIGTIDSGNIPCEYGQKINESMQKDPFMLSDRNTIDKEKLSRSVILKSQIRNHDRIDTNNGSAVASAENTSIDNVNCIELTRIPVKLKKHNVVADSSNISCPNSKSGSERSTSYLNSTSRWPHEKSNNNKKQSVVNISTISQKDLMKFLSRYNLTLKAVPENTSCTVNMGLAKFRTVSVDSNRQNSHVSSLGQLSDASNAKTFILSDSETIQNKFQPGSNETGKNPVANRKLRYEGNTIFRSTPQGTFSDWKIEGARSAKLCKRRSRVRFNGNIGRICKKSMKIRNSACFEYTETGNKNLLKKNKIADVAQPTVSTYNRSETLDTSGFECPFKMFPLSNAFRDLELRDKATRETLETSKDFNNSVSVGSATGQYLRTLSPTMTSLFNDGSCLLNAGEFHADPVLTSAVAFNSTETVAGDLSDDFVINQVLLSPVASKNKSLTCRNFTCLKRKTSVLEKEDITTSSSEDNKSQSVGESTNITELASENLYGFPVSDMEDEASNSIPSIDLSAPKCSVGDSSTKYCVKRSKSTTTRDNIAMTLKSNKYGCNNSTNKSNLCHRGTKNCVIVSSATLSSCHCSTDACVVSHDSNTSSRSERTQVGTEFNKKNKDITQQQLSKYPTKAIEKWSSEEVASWLNDTIRHYELDKTSLCTNLDSKNVENQKRTGNIFSGSFLNGRALRNLELDKFHEYCKNDLLLAEHLIKKVKELLTFLNGKSDSEREINENEMYHQYRGQCVVVNPNCVPATSVEQLEESVNFEDLLGSDSVLGSLEIADVLDFQGSFLKSLGQENERRLHHRTHSCNSTEFFHNHFSPAGRVPSYEESTLHKNKFAHYPDVYHDTRSELLSNDSVQHSLLKEFSSYPQQNKVHDFFTQASYDDSVSSTTEYYPPVSPSTYYNVPPPPLIAMHDCVSNVSTEVTQKPASIVSASGELATPNFISLRDPAMSDTDSGIHSPESSPNKYTPVVNTTGRIGNNMPDNTENRVKLNGVSYCGNNTAWQQANSSLLKSLSQNVAANILTEVSVPSKNDSTCPVNDEGSKEDLWERGSTSSTTSTLTAGESEPKLFNMDDCQTYIADASMQSLPSFANSTSSLTVRTLDGNVVFVPSSLNDATKANAANSMVQSQNTKGCHQFVTQGNITTVYPSFVSHNRRIGTTTQDGEVGVNGFRGQNMESIVPTNALITKQHSDPLCGIQNRRFTGFHSNKKRQFQNGLSRRHTCDGQDAAFIDSFDLKVRRTSGKSIHLWEFIRDTLLDQTYCPSLIKWEDRKSGIFRFVQSDIVAGMWGKKKNNPKMTYEKLSRAMRYYYNRGILERVDGRRLVYKFGPNAHGWQQIGESNETQEPDQNIQEEVKVKPEKGPRNNPLQSQKNSLTTSLRRPANCKISVTMSDNVLPDSRKRRRCSSDQTRQNKSTIDVAVKAKSTETQTMPSLIEQIVKVKKECEKMMEVKPESFKSTPSPQAEPTSCIVYVARQVQPAEKKERQCKEDKVSLVPSPEALKWSNDQQISNSPSKLPSAEVLLGKHYKIATVAT